MTRSKLALAAVCAFAMLVPGVNAAGPFERVGIALTPRNFPNHGPDDVRHMFETASEVGDVGVYIYQWSQPDFLRVAEQMVKVSAQQNLTPVLALSPTVLSGMRGEFDLPRELRGRKSFADKPVYERFIRDALELAKLKPAYLCLGTEINLLAMSDLKQFLTFAHVYKQLYKEVKKISPQTKVFVSFQWDFIHRMDTDEPKQIKEHTKLFDVFRPELDVIAITSYPSDHYDRPSDVPADYYKRLFNHVSKKDEIMVMEIGWPTTGKGNEQEQLAFVKRMPELFADVNPRIVAWSLLHDVGGSGLSGELASTGLLTRDGKAKPALEAFKELGQ